MTFAPTDKSLDDIDRALLYALEDGLPLVSRPYEALASRIGIAADDVIARVARMREAGIIKRFGLVVRHHELGYRANGMVVWDVPDGIVQETGHRLGGFPFVTLCYRRPRQRPQWPYNLFTMIHGQDREQVLARVAELITAADLSGISHEVLFSRRRFKQRGARYSAGRPDDRLPTIGAAAP